MGQRVASIQSGGRDVAFKHEGDAVVFGAAAGLTYEVRFR
jgi:hypothetical protein